MGSFLYFSCLLSLVSSALAPQNVPRQAFNIPYKFLYCDTTQSVELSNVFNYLSASIENTVIPEAKKGESSAAFNTFFSHNGPDNITSIFNQISQGPTDKLTTTPTLVCIN